MSSKDTVKSRGDKIATAIFRTLIGIFGTAVLVVTIRFRLYAQGWEAVTALGGFCGLLLGYAVGGDKWGARLFTIFTGHRVRIESARAGQVAQLPNEKDN